MIRVMPNALGLNEAHQYKEGAMVGDEPTRGEIYVNADGEGQIDLHGFHPYDEQLADTIIDGVRQAYEKRLPTLTIIHGHGFNRASFSWRLVNSNTGWLGQTVRRFLRQPSELRQWMFAKIDCSHNGSTTVRLRRPSD